MDNSWSKPADLIKIRRYFHTAGTLIRSAGYKIGGYGSGLVCEELLNNGLADYCWLSNATSWPGHDNFYATNRWSLKQFAHQTCAGHDVDFNQMNSSIPDIGQFN